jgi:hypothetical protein
MTRAGGTGRARNGGPDRPGECRSPGKTLEVPFRARRLHRSDGSRMGRTSAERVPLDTGSPTKIEANAGRLAAPGRRVCAAGASSRRSRPCPPIQLVAQAPRGGGRPPGPSPAELEVGPRVELGTRVELRRGEASRATMETPGGVPPLTDAHRRSGAAERVAPRRSGPWGSPQPSRAHVQGLHSGDHRPAADPPSYRTRGSAA